MVTFKKSNCNWKNLSLSQIKLFYRDDLRSYYYSPIIVNDSSL